MWSFRHTAKEGKKRHTQPSEVKYGFAGQLRTQSCVTTSSKERINSNFTCTCKLLGELQPKIKTCVCFNSQKFLNSQVYTIQSILSLAGDTVQALLQWVTLKLSCLLLPEGCQIIKFKKENQNTTTLSL